MIAPSSAAPRRYFVDAVGRRVLIGLTIEETQEFERLDLAQSEQSTSVAGKAAVASLGLDDQRWLALYEKHDSAWRSWMGSRGLLVALKSSLTTGERSSSNADLEREFHPCSSCS